MKPDSSDPTESLKVAATAEAESPKVAATAEAESPKVAATAEAESPKVAATAEAESPKVVATTEAESPKVAVAAEAESPKVVATTEAESPGTLKSAYGVGNKLGNVIGLQIMLALTLWVLTVGVHSFFGVSLGVSFAITAAFLFLSSGLLLYLEPALRSRPLPPPSARNSNVLESLSTIKSEPSQWERELVAHLILHAERNRVRERLHGEVQNLGRRNNVNLVIGSVATLAAAAMLGYVVFKAPVGTPSWYDFAAYYAVRLAVVILVEVFAFFFLRLYRAGLEEVKYFQNEITNVEMRILAVDAAFTVADVNVRADVVREMAKTERNFVLKAGETTVELEKLRSEREALKDLAQAASSLLKAKG